MPERINMNSVINFLYTIYILYSLEKGKKN